VTEEQREPPRTGTASEPFSAEAPTIIQPLVFPPVSCCRGVSLKIQSDGELAGIIEGVCR
jgi:hypothetical protein